MPFNAPQQTAQPQPELYTILDAKIQGGMSGSNTLVYLETPQKKQLYAYVRGVRQELTRGDRKSTRLNSSHTDSSRMPSSA